MFRCRGPLFLTAIAVLSVFVPTAGANAQDSFLSNMSRFDRDFPRSEDRNRQQTKNNWRNIAIGAGAAALYGYAKKDKTLLYGGIAGTLYSLNRYEQDRKSQNQADRARAAFFSRPYFERDGERYERRLVRRKGQRYYRFVRCR
ncbi:MAG: hypothetical protein SFU56_02905 [Capsulimonadales bacterium]|nr:hypothetical protein [Capsulimonadales bacterium]